MALTFIMEEWNGMEEMEWNGRKKDGMEMAVEMNGRNI